MENIIQKRIEEYGSSNEVDYVNSIREVIQELTLFALSKTDFFSKAAFLGGTALRIFYGLDRASEYLDFSLIKNDDSFSLDNYIDLISKTLASFGLDVEVINKKSIGAVQSAFVKGDTITNLINIGLDGSLSKRIGHISSIKVKIEVDTNPPEGAEYEYKTGLFPFPYRVLTYDKGSLFAGKLHALLCRNWIKGRDYYDYVFYLSHNVTPNMTLLRNSLIQTNFLNNGTPYDINCLKKDLCSRFSQVDYEAAKSDCRAFIKDIDELSLWNSEFFIDITNQYLK